jgi:hypothetical protein
VVRRCDIPCSSFCIVWNDFRFSDPDRRIHSSHSRFRFSDRRTDDTSRRGIARGHEVLFDEFPSRALVDRFVRRGFEGIRTMCRAIEPDPYSSEEFVADRLAAQRRTRAPVIYELADDASSSADHIAVRVLGHWDEPRSVDTLLRIAEDPARREEVREGAVDAYGTPSPWSSRRPPTRRRRSR